MPPVSELNNHVWCRLAPSPIHGVGVFAIRDIPKGTVLGTYGKDGGKMLYSPEGWSDVLPVIQALMLDRHPLDSPDEPEVIMSNPNWDAEMVCFMNHSHDANSNGHVALRDIKKGEEVTENYLRFSEPLPVRTNDYYRSFI